MESIISLEKVKDLLPQKYPFAMVDSLLTYEEESVLTSYTVEENDIFAINGVLNESGLIENFAQSIALHTSYGYFLRNEKAPIGYIGSISNLKVYDFPKVGDKIETSVTIVKEFMGITLVEGETRYQGEVILTAKMKTFIAEE